MFLLTTRLTAWLRLARREERWKTAEILILRHQLAVLQRRQPRRPRLDWADRALIASLLAVIPKARRHGLRLLVSPDTILRWHRDIVGRRWAARSIRGKTGRPASHPPEHQGPGPPAGPREPRLDPRETGLQRRQARLPGLGLGPLAALRASAPEREPGTARILRPGHPATLPGQHPAPPERSQRRMRLPGHRVRQPAVPRLRGRPRPPLILAARVGAPGDFLSGLGHRQAPFR